MEARIVTPRPLCLAFVVLTALLFSASCRMSPLYFLQDMGDASAQLSELFRLLDAESEDSANRFVVMQQIIGIYNQADELSRLALFLTTHVEQAPDDPYNGYYLFVVGQTYEASRAYPFAAYYYDRIVRNYPDLVSDNVSIHHSCLMRLVDITEDPGQRAFYLQELIAHFPDRVDRGAIFYRLGKTYEELGEYTAANQAYRQFLLAPPTEIAGEPNARRDIQGLIDFSNSGKSWTMDSLDDLINIIREAILTKNVALLRQYKAAVGFFTISPNQQVEDAHLHATLDLYSIVFQSAVVFDLTRTPDSNADEAYIRTTGWQFYIRDWTLYFRRVHYPADPEINGRWEWAGIYFGNQL